MTSLMGVVNVTPDSFSDGGLFLEPEAAIAHGAQLARGRGRDPRRRRRVDPARGRRGRAVEEEIARTEPVVSDLAGLGHTVSIDTSKLAVAEAALDAGATIVNDVTALRGDPEIGRALRRARRRAGADAHAGHAADDAGGPALRRRRRRRQGVPRRAARGGARRRRRRGADLARPGDRLRQDARAQPRAAAAPRRAARAGPAAGRRHLAQELHRQDRRLRGGPSGSAARSPPRSSPPPRAPRCSGSTTSPRSPRR